MGIFDVFTGGSVKDAANENMASLSALKGEGMGYLDTGLKRSTGAIKGALGNFDALRQKYGQGTDLYLDALGVRGPEGNTRATSAFQAGPGYDWQVDQALDGYLRKQDAMGMTRSGNTSTGLVDRASGLANQEYGNWLGRLGGLVNPEMAAATGGAGLSTSLAGLYERDAGNRVGLASNVTGGMMNNNNMAANAEMQGSGNLWNMGLNLLKLGTGMAGGMGGGMPPIAPGG